jgi:hypothetical protein
MIMPKLPTTIVIRLTEHERLTIELADRFTEALKAGDVVELFFAKVAAEMMLARQNQNQKEQ